MLIAGRYRLRDAIGRGAMGEVWRADDETLGRPVAVKLLLPQDSDPTAASRFRLEAQTAGRLSHPHVVGVLDFGEYEDRLFLVMELVEGDSLARLLAVSGPLPAERVARLAAEAAAGLAAAHRQGIVHRDIKPANLLLDADGTLKIGDFGIARFIDDPGAALTATGQIVGTSLYLAPERALGRPAEPASDIYALGCLLYQLLTGRPPFQADTALAILHQHLDATPVPPRQFGANLPPAFESYLLGLLAKEPEDRPTAEEVADWFARGAWRGMPEPLPSEYHDRSRPGGPPVTGSGAAAPAASAPTAPAAGVFVPVADTEWKTSVHRAAPSRSRLPFLRRSRPVAVLGGAALFTVALLVGLAWFSPGTGSAQGPRTGPSTSTTPATSPSSTPAGTVSSPTSTPSLSSSPAQPASEETEKATDAKPSPKKADRHGGKGKH
ncbi:serine/threonine-protein kinase [Streptomyces albicerus]|uniref:serine/threonine-protein kinase n=1 Tax=Streptomyces albicerus TaxID=2569859 RepID=UPI00124BA29D|nr:serine/threonine-protein kinase [Streptomyces albicerus]